MRYLQQISTTVRLRLVRTAEIAATELTSTRVNAYLATPETNAQLVSLVLNSCVDFMVVALVF